MIEMLPSAFFIDVSSYLAVHISTFSAAMDDTILRPASQLLYILNHQLVTDELAASPQNARFVLDAVDNARLILEADRDAQRDETAQSAVHR